MTPSNLSTLSEISQAVQDADASKLQAIRAEESRIRSQLAALDDHHNQTRALPMAEALPHCRLGGDLLWQVWVGRRRRELQMQLARCLARQGSARRALQKSFGKRAALEGVRNDLRAKSDRIKKIKAFDTATSLGLLGRGRL